MQTTDNARDLRPPKISLTREQWHLVRHLFRERPAEDATTAAEYPHASGAEYELAG